MKVLSARLVDIRYVIIIVFFLCGCKKDEDVFPLVGKWKMAPYLKTTIIYTSGGIQYENSYIKTITPSNTIMEYKGNGEIIQGNDTLSYKKDVLNGDNWIIVISKLSNYKSLYTWSIDSEGTLNLALENYWEALGNPSDANKLVLGKSLASSSPIPFPNIASASAVHNVVITYVYYRQ